MTRHSLYPKTRTYVKEYGFLTFTRKYMKQILDKGLDDSKNVLHKAGEFIGNKIADAVAKSNNHNSEKQETVDEVIIPLEKNK